uniref:CD80-like immunoglobulin C2-set domain-containing protein n=1 Tax=Glossina palpalis gambiensis TaxID=67801 RepID=A0A1B0B5Q9_9MUSC
MIHKSCHVTQVKHSNEFPEKRPQLFTELTRYEPGDILRANCSTPPSRPRAELRFTINNMPLINVEYD